VRRARSHGLVHTILPRGRGGARSHCTKTKQLGASKDSEHTDRRQTIQRGCYAVLRPIVPITLIDSRPWF
jgi:hypothetical protein